MLSLATRGMLIVSALVAAALALSQPAEAQPIPVRTVTVNCSQPGQTIAAALRRQVLGGGLIVNISGTCNEHVDIFRDDVILRGAAAGATIHGPTTTDQAVFIDGAKRVHLQDLTVTGGSDGVSGANGASFFLDNVTVQGATRLGVVASYNATAYINGSTIQQSGSNGVTAANAAVVVITNSTVQQNVTGIIASRASHIRVGQNSTGTTLGPVVVQNNSGNGIQVVDASAAIVVSTTVKNNGGNGIYVARGSTADVGIGSFSLVGANTIMSNGAGSSGILVEGGSANIVGNTITDNGFGVQFINGGNGRFGITPSTTYLGNNVSVNKLAGLLITNGATAVIGANTISGNGVGTTAGNRWGVFLNQGAASFIGKNVIENHADSGIFAFMSSLWLGNGFGSLDRTGNIVRNNGFGSEGTTTRGGITIFDGSTAFVLNTTVTGNSDYNIGTFVGGTAEIRTATLSSPVGAPGADPTTAKNLLINQRGTIRLGGGSIVETSPGDAIKIFSGGALDFRNDSPVIVRNNGGFPVNCFGNEASIGKPNNANDPQYIGNGAGDVENGCSGY